MRGAVSNKERWTGRRAPTHDPSTNHLLSRTVFAVAIIIAVSTVLMGYTSVQNVRKTGITPFMSLC